LLVGSVQKKLAGGVVVGERDMEEIMVGEDSVKII
jgi:hypothetical protein